MIRYNNYLENVAKLVKNDMPRPIKHNQFQLKAGYSNEMPLRIIRRQSQSWRVLPSASVPTNAAALPRCLAMSNRCLRKTVARASPVCRAILPPRSAQNSSAQGPHAPRDSIAIVFYCYNDSIIRDTLKLYMHMISIDILIYCA